jgi:signal transduction histidine kinase
MSYRAFKRLLGETSLERKCRFLFGGFILLLITASFWLYARQTEHLAYDQLPTTCRLLVNHAVARQIATTCCQREPDDPFARHRGPLGAALAGASVSPLHLAPALFLKPKEPIDAQRRRALDEFRAGWEEDRLKELEGRGVDFFTPGATRRQNKPDSDYDQERLKEFLSDSSRNEDSQLLPWKKEFHYYGAVRATRSCLECHQRDNAALREGDLIAVVKISLPTQTIEDGVHRNRAVLLCTALAAALLIMGGSYLIVRYVIVKPVKHLKEVSDAISAGELNVRSEIQTGDEFEDLSHAFNRMLRNLVAMQDRLRKVNADLDRKVDELAQANLALFESNQLKSDFLATMSHELRTPLNSILGFSDVLLSGDQLSDKQQRWVSNIKSSGDRLLALINDILDLAKIEAGKMQVRITEFSIYDICEGMLTMFRPLAEKKNIDLRGQFDAGVPLLRQDAGKIQQILSNLLSNAIKFTPEGGRVQLRLQPAQDRLPLDRSPAPAPREILLVVSDTGVGITPEEQELVFEKFRQGANPLTREHAGTGLGLSITRELTRLLGGEVTLQSQVGRGSTFTVRLSILLNAEPPLEFDLARESNDLSKSQRLALLYAPPQGVGEATP